MIVFDILGQ